jgi:HNH endonuclease
MSTTEERFTAKVLILEDTCHLWVGAISSAGYGAFWFDYHLGLAHRYAWLRAFDALPPTPLELDHLCRKRACVNVFHLEAVTRKVNVERGLRTNTLTCQSGRHPWVPENQAPTSNGVTCRACRQEYNRRYWASRKGA